MQWVKYIEIKITKASKHRAPKEKKSQTIFRSISRFKPPFEGYVNGRGATFSLTAASLGPGYDGGSPGRGFSGSGLTVDGVGGSEKSRMDPRALGPLKK